MDPLTIEEKWGCAFVLLLNALGWCLILWVIYKVVRWLV